MNYKLSNTASKTSLELTFGLSLKYPNIYKPQLVIDGLKEQSIAIITMDEPNAITEGIWGILPQDFQGDWRKFQKLKTTLHTNKEEISRNVLYKEALEKRRCLILATGFYIHHIVDTEIETYLVEKENAAPFALAGIYNILEDGFVTCSVINTEMNDLLSSKQNLYNYMPLEIPLLFKNIWLSPKTASEDILHIISKPYLTKFKIQRIAS
ncbi:SOS response-associated peptidase family protein [Kordia sp. YSTF-M3]|uniref:SOS response-associated peptidase family protein n=1 Tax=Kordia aestuariivivens TaxID=2759037 RepID=A0ABR7Q3K6_9FLAO|nr:SOS response-associated peptidase family protein [Kordia aestuariivivens]MBC8753136.1 SOS response-associated peptidase family protein [Kordia aestuariivivens]